ncbi:MAG TPA: type II toxin-antitoxin system RelE/ParE family toxin [Acidobacteriaceae bacterium]|nr:type II toxin-antitoxin system RelE/ParE family toxin [Acidobacteriaceae bacterium]
MIEIRETETFSSWLKALRDDRARARIAARIRRLAFGNPGDVKPVGEGITELRIHEGAGYRVYFVQRGTLVIVLLCAGDKATQAKDIATAKRLAKDIQ